MKLRSCLLAVLALAFAVSGAQAAPANKTDLFDDLLAKKEDVKQDALGLEKAAEFALTKFHTFTVWTKNTDRELVPLGPPGSGNEVFAWGTVYDNPAATGPPIGAFYLSAVVINVDVASATEMRNVFIEVSFDKNFTSSKDLNLRRAAADKAGLAAPFTDDIECSGVERYPIGGAILSAPLSLAVTGGIGAYTGVRGQVQISYNAAAQIFEYKFMIA